MSTYEITAEDFYANYRECKPGDDDTCMSLCDTSEPVLDSICTYVSRGARAAFARRARARRHRLNSHVGGVAGATPFHPGRLPHHRACPAHR